MRIGNVNSYYFEYKNNDYRFLDNFLLEHPFRIVESDKTDKDDKTIFNVKLKVSANLPGMSLDIHLGSFKMDYNKILMLSNDNTNSTDPYILEYKKNIITIMTKFEEDNSDVFKYILISLFYGRNKYKYNYKPLNLK